MKLLSFTGSLSRELGKTIVEADALTIATPEYSGGISSVLPKIIDWVLRLKPMP
jgi:NAD(P)H-dependent FMN reductase